MKKAVIIALLYLVFGIFWIYFSDSLVFTLFNDPEEIQKMSNYKGFVFVFLSALLLLLAIFNVYKNVLKQKNQIDILFSNPDIGFIQVSETGVILDINENIANKLGYTRKELLRRKTGDFTHKEDFKEDIYQWELFKQDHNSTYTRKKRYLHKNGTPIWFHLIGKMVKDFKGNPYFIAAIIDISEQKKVDAIISSELKEKEALINNTTDVIWSVDKNIQLNSFNLAYTQLIKKYYKIRPRTGDSILDKYTDEKEKQFWLQGYLKALNNEIFSVTNKREKEGKLTYFKTSMNPILSDHKVIGIACSSKDITEEQNLIETLKNTIKEKEISQDIFQAIFENIPIMISLFDHNDRTLKLNKELLQTFGLNENETYSLDVLNHIIHNEKVRSELRSNILIDFKNWKDFQVTTPNGELRKQKWINILIKKDRSLSIGIDIERLKENTNNNFIYVSKKSLPE
ncbi:MAG: hypothetical protein COS19_11055 [Flavobacteriaceae bacterium CG02_land_8_20_14_3_00_34_13]|nr:MAG: hypothetical protein COS19_11055 [Flavobacteriaceae bacterium CG02_land_8_20_14_3_00_34_13]